jgi:23S rRNA (guanine2445-N2)-methyltransferase / 23S rRNA (guanine2069-N7)-methyltransferase
MPPAAPTTTPAAERSVPKPPPDSTSPIRSFFVSAALGLESLLAQELERMGATSVSQASAGVYVEGTLELAYRACLWSRVGSRVLWPIATFAFGSTDELYEGARQVPWSEHVDPSKTVAVHTTAVDAIIGNARFASLRVKDAIVDELRAQTGERPSVDTEAPDLRVNVHLQVDEATIAIDLAGEGLHRRGYRTERADAPLREDLAAALLIRSRWHDIAARGGGFADPMCGSGTLPIEAALMAADAAPGLARSRWGFEGWRKHDAALWDRLVREARARRAAGIARLPAIRGSDSDAGLVELARRNVERAELSGCVEIRHADVRAAEPPPGPPGLVAVNPPWGLRLGEADDLAPLYGALGHRLREAYGGWEATVLTANRDLARAIGLRPRRRGKLRQSGVECHLLRYRIHAERLGDNNT